MQRFQEHMVSAIGFPKILQFLSLIDSLRFSLRTCDQTLPFIPHLFQRFPNLTSLDLTCFSKDGDIDALLYQISTFPLNLKTLKLSNQSTFPAGGLRALSEKITTLTSLTCSDIVSLDNDDLVCISVCFPFLEELDISTSIKSKFVEFNIVDVGLNTMLTSLPKLRKVNIDGRYDINYDSLLLQLCKNCEFLEEVVIFNCFLLTYNGIASAIRKRPGLRSLSFTKFGELGNFSSHFINSLVSLKGINCLNLSYSDVTDELLLSIAQEGLPLRRLVLRGCSKYTYAGIFNLLSKCQSIQYLDLQRAHFLKDCNFVELSLFLVDLVSINISHCSRLTIVTLSALLRNCSKLSEVRMEHTDTAIAEMSVENSSTLMNLVVNPQLKSLHLAYNIWLTEKHLDMFASVLPNLQLLDLRSWNCISENGIGQVLKRCSKIRQLSIVCSPRLDPLRMNFKVSTLEVLNLSGSEIDDKSLDVISKSCFRLLQLDLACCYNITEKGVRQAIENCTQLREINLKFCTKVAVDVVDSMIFIRPALRKITTPPLFRCTESKRKLFLRLGCLIC